MALELNYLRQNTTTQDTTGFTMPKKNKKTRSSRKDCRKKIKSIDITSECLSSRSGLAPFVNFLHGSSIADELEELLQHLRKSKKGIRLSDVFFQTLMFFADGTDRCLGAFDKLKENKAWQDLHGCKRSLGTAQLKRLLSKVNQTEINELRPLLCQVFLKALKSSSPDKVVLFLDSSVYDNDGAKCRAGVKPTYKKKEGYHPINLIWQGLYVDTVFQAGDRSTNHGDVATTMLQKVTQLIRETLGDEIPILVRMDGGYYDQKIFATCDALKIKFVCAGKRYKDHQNLKETRLEDFDGIFQNNHSTWHYLRFQEQRKSWSETMSYRALFLRPTEENGEALLGLDSRIIISNLSEEECSDEQIIQYDHSRGADELTHRAAKEFSSERMPSLDYHANAFWYTLSIIAFNLFQVFKRDIAFFPFNSYPNTVRRKLFDLAGKIVKGSHCLTLKISEWKMKELKFEAIWQRSLVPWSII